MKISVIIPTYNEEQSIQACLASLAKQRLKDFEVIVVDDGSTDNTKNTVQQTKKEMPGLHLLIFDQNHQGPAAARNLGAKHAQGEVLVFVDADMTFDKAFLNKLVAPIVSGKAGATFSSEEIVANWDKVWARCWNYRQGLPAKRRHKAKPDSSLYEYLSFIISRRTLSRKAFSEEANKRHTHIYRAVKRSLFAKVGGYDSGGYTDDYSLAAKIGKPAVAVNGARFYHENPPTLSEAFRQSRWVSKRTYKFGKLGLPVVFAKLSLPVSLLAGLAGAVRHATPAYLIFRVVYDAAATLGVVDYYFRGRGAK